MLVSLFSSIQDPRSSFEGQGRGQVLEQLEAMSKVPKDPGLS